MKRFKLFLFILLFLTVFTSSGFSFTFNSSAVLQPQTLAIGPAVYGAVNAYWGSYLITEYGLVSRFNCIIKLGYVNEENNSAYIGGEGKYLITEVFGGTDFFSMILGGHYKKDPGLDIALQFGNSFQSLDTYFSFDLDYNFSKEPVYPLSFIVGIKFTAFSKSDLVIELGIPVTSDDDYKLGSALRFNL